MTTKILSSSQLLAKSWYAFKKNASFLITVMAGLFIVVGGLDIIASIYKTSAPLAAILFSLIGSMLQFIIMIGLITVVLKITKNEIPTYADIFKNTSLFVDYMLAGIYRMMIAILFLAVFIILIPTHSVLIISTGGIAVFILWVYIMIRISMYAFIIIDQKVSPITSFRESYRITGGFVYKILILTLIAIILNIAGAVFFVIGLLVTMPLSLLLIAYAYRELEEVANTPKTIEVTPLPTP